MHTRMLAIGSAVTLLILLAVGVLAGCESETASQQSAVATSPDRPSTPRKTDQFTVRLEEAQVDVDEPTVVNMLVLPGRGLKINLEYPWSIEFQETAGISLPKTTFSKGDIDLADEQATVPLTVHAQESGEFEITAVANFSVCNDDRCDILRGEPLAVKVQAVASTP